MRGIATMMNRSRNSHIRAPRSVTEQPISCPSRSPKFAIDFLALAIDRLLAGDHRELLDHRVEQLRLLDRFAHADVEHDLLERRHLVRVRQRELLREARAHRLLVERLQPRLPTATLGAGSVRQASRPSRPALGLRRPRPLRLVCRRPSAPSSSVPPWLTGSSQSTAPTSRRPAPPCRRRRRRRRMRVGSPVFGSSSITFE